MKIILFCFSVLTFESVCAQYKSNQKNIDSYKQGIYDDNGWICEYKNDSANGICLGFDRNISPRKLSSAGCYKNNVPVGTWIYFDDKGNIISIIKNIRKNDSITIVSKHYYFKDNKPNYIAYEVNFFSSGIVRSEGPMAFNEDFNGDDSYYFGEWKYYNENGELIEKK